MAEDEAAGTHGGALAVIACASARDRSSLTAPLTAGGVRTLATADTPALLEDILASRPDVLIVDLDLAREYAASVGRMIADHPELATLPVLLVLPEGGVGPLPPSMAPYVADVVFRPVGDAELLHRTLAAISRRRRHRAQRDASAALRGAMRDISADIRATNDPTVMTEQFLSGVGSTLGADHAALEVFEDERVAARGSAWTAATGRAGLDVPRREHRPEDLALALGLWERSTVAGFSSADHAGTGAISAEGGTSSVAAPPWIAHDLADSRGVSGVVLALGEGDTPFGLLWLVSEAPSTLGWSAVEASLTQHVLGNLAHGLIQAQLISRQQQAVRKLRALNQAKTDFVGSVNHELRTPLASMTGYLEMILDGLGGELPAEAQTMLRAVERNTAKLNQLIENISSLSTERTDESEHGPVDLAHLVADLTRALETEAADAGVRLACSVPDRAVVVAGSREELAAALGIVLSNALKFSRPDGEITTELAVEPTGSGVTLLVTDTGIGIPPDDLPRLFDPFQRAANTQQVLPGAGVGLAVARRTLEAHHGTISITSELGEGTTVAITLPLLDHAAVGPPEAPWTETP